MGKCKIMKNKKFLYQLFFCITLLSLFAACQKDPPPVPLHSIWGLGENLTAECSNDVGYEWYIDQFNTGKHTFDNCGPACVTMAIKWTDLTFTGTVQDARNTYKSEGGWWHTNDIRNYLNNYSISNFTMNFVDANALKNELDNKNIAILCLDMYYVRYQSENPEWHVDKFYIIPSEGGGHFIIVKGYKIVDEITWFEVYDPWSLGVRYMDGSLKGRNRYYRSEDIMKATDVRWKYMIVVQKSTTTRSAVPIPDYAIDPSTIVDQSGR